MKYKIGVSLLLLSLFTGIIQASEKLSSDTTIMNYSAFKRSVAINGLMQTRYVYSLTDNVNINGVHFDEDNTSISHNTNSFLMRRVRVNTRATINDHFDASVLINLAEFSGNTTNRVLENAFIRYHKSKSFNIMAGQFRPFFGPEDMLPADIIKSLDYSNQYNLFSNSGWQSFQIGVAVYGDLNTDGKLPFHYYAGAYNGNNRNQPLDNDDRKNYYGRLEADLAKNVRIGINAAQGSWTDQKGHAWGGDISAIMPLAKCFKFELISEYKEGTNFAEFAAAPAAEKRAVGDYYNRGFYVFPNFRYECNMPRLRSIEFSSRYEYLQENYKVNDNLRQTVTPMVSFEFADDYYARIEVGCMIDMFKHDIANTAQYSHNTGVVQLQVRF